MDFAALIAAIKAKFGEIRTKIEEKMAKLGPLEQLEVGQDVVSALRYAKYSVQEIEEIGNQLNQIEARYTADAEAAKAAGVEAALKAGEVIRKEDHDLAVTNAAAEAKDEIRAEFKQKEDSQKLITDRRAKAAEKVGVEAANALRDEDLGADDFDARLATLEKRVGEMKEFGVLGDKESTRSHFRKFAAFALDAEGDKKFAGEFADLKNLLGGKPIKHESAGGEGGAGGHHSRGAQGDTSGGGKKLAAAL